jgi:outer membrane protein assembly factor BamB
MVALDLRSGRRVWERNVGGSHTPWIAGDFLFLVSVEQKVAALSKDDGTVFWVTQLKRFKNEKRTKGLINWTGPALVAGKLILLSDDEKMVVIDPVDGSIVSTTGISAAGSMGPTIAQGTVLILTDDATLTAYR